jgi:orotate phosphoribosyltransferase
MGGTSMETRSKEIKAHNQPLVSMTMTPGHFATRNSHINFYIDLTAIKSHHNVARCAASVLAAKYGHLMPIDTIVCLEGMEVVAAFLAATLSDGNGRGSSKVSSIAILTPEINVSGQLMFRDNFQEMIWNRNVLLLVASVTTGNTISHAMGCIDYYNGHISGICALFSAIDAIGDIKVKSIFSIADVPGYSTFSPADCPDCKAKHKIDALVNSFGYSKI